MSQTSIDRLRDYLAQLPPQSQALLMREFERAIERGDDLAVANFVLGELRKIVRGAEPESDIQARTDDPARMVFRALEPYLIDGNQSARPGQIRRASLVSIWQWLERDGIPQDLREFKATLAGLRGRGTPSEIEPPVRKLQLAAADAINKVVNPEPGVDRQRALARVGAPAVLEDLPSIGAVLKNRDVLEAFNGKLPSNLRVFADSQINSVISALNLPALQTPVVLPFALSLVMLRLSAPWQVIRLALKVCGSDDELKVAATAYGVAVTMAIHDLAVVTGTLREDIRRSHFANVSEHLKTVHDGVRGLRTELDIRNDSAWGRQLAAIRVEISNALKSELDSVPGRVRRLLRQRPDMDIPAGAKIDPAEVDEVAALIDFVAICRNYASELAINEVTLRTYSDLQQYVEKATESLVQSLRGGDNKTRAYRQMQAKAAIRFCEVLFGQDYASLMSRAAESAQVVVERKPSRAS
jgi:hypothetical protein